MYDRGINVESVTKNNNTNMFDQIQKKVEAMVDQECSMYSRVNNIDCRDIARKYAMKDIQMSPW